MELRRAGLFPGAACCQPPELAAYKAAPLRALGLALRSREGAFESCPYQLLDPRPDSREITGATATTHVTQPGKQEAFPLQPSVPHLRVGRVCDESYQFGFIPMA